MVNVLNGRIVKAIAGFFYVYTENYGIIECHAKGILRKGKYRPLVGDLVKIELLDENDKKGNLIFIDERVNSCIRPEVANVDSAILIFAFDSPAPNLLLLDRFLIMLEKQGIHCNICFNKMDICDDTKRKAIIDAYTNSGYLVYEVSATENIGIDVLKQQMKGKVTVLAGPSGVGKSSILNLLYPEANAKTGEISKKSERGKHTTRHSELFSLGNDTFVLDTPGFTALEFMDGLEANELKAYYKEMYEYEGKCKYDPCSHTHEPYCAVKDAVINGHIEKIRYQNYCSLYEELKNKTRF